MEQRHEKLDSRFGLCPMPYRLLRGDSSFEERRIYRSLAYMGLDKYGVGLGLLGSSGTKYAAEQQHYCYFKRALQSTRVAAFAVVFPTYSVKLFPRRSSSSPARCCWRFGVSAFHVADTTTLARRYLNGSRRVLRSNRRSVALCAASSRQNVEVISFMLIEITKSAHNTR